MPCAGSASSLEPIRHRTGSFIGEHPDRKSQVKSRAMTYPSNRFRQDVCQRLLVSLDLLLRLPLDLNNRLHRGLLAYYWDAEVLLFHYPTGTRTLEMETQSIQDPSLT